VIVWSDEKVALLALFLHAEPALLDLFVARIDVVRFCRENPQLAYLAVWADACNRYRKRYGVTPTSPQALQLALQESARELQVDAAEKLAGLFSLALRGELQALKQERELGIKLLQQFLVDFYVKPQLGKLSFSALDGLQLQQKLEELQTELLGLLKGEEAPTGFYILQDPQKYIGRPSIRRTGVAVWDALFTGGLKPTEVYVILGPTGGGKTTLAIQLSVSVAVKGHHVFYATYEQRPFVDGADGRPISEFTIRALSMLSGYDRNELVNLDFSDPNLLPPAVKNGIELAKLGQHNLWLHDGLSASLAEAALPGLLRIVETRHQKRKIDLLVIDPLWPLVERTMAASGDPPTVLRTRVMSMMTELSAFAKKHKLTILLTHQVSASGAESKRFNTYAAAEVRSLGWRPENCCVISMLDEHRRGYFVCAKSRSSGMQGQRCRVQLQGELCRFVPAKTDTQSMLFLAEDEA